MSGLVDLTVVGYCLKSGGPHASFVIYLNLHHHQPVEFQCCKRAAGPRMIKQRLKLKILTGNLKIKLISTKKKG